MTFLGFFENFKKVTGVWLFFGLRSLVWNNDILCDDPPTFSANIFLKISTPELYYSYL